MSKDNIADKMFLKDIFVCGVFFSTQFFEHRLFLSQNIAQEIVHGGKMKRKCLLAIFMGLIFMALPASAIEPSTQNGPAYDAYDENWTAKDAAEWQTVRATLKQIESSSQSPDQKCQARWNAIWPVAKEGNPEARYVIGQSFSTMSLSPYRNVFAIKGRPIDSIYATRDAVVGYIYGLGSPTQRYTHKSLSKDELINKIWLMAPRFC